MVSLYSSHAHGAHFYDLSKLLHSQVNMVGFVDDTSGSINVFLSPKVHEPTYYINLTTHDAQLWNNILSLSGGALQAAKCSYHLLYFDFTSVGITYIPQNIGIHKAPATKSTKQIDTLIWKSQHYSKVLGTNYLLPTEAWIFYNTIYLPSITYPFPYHQSARLLSRPKTNKSTATPKMQLQLQLSNSSCLQFTGPWGNWTAPLICGIFHLVHQSLHDFTPQHRHAVTTSMDSSRMGSTHGWH